jgi:toxin-antitoxin system PIN domain toxin
MPYLLDVNMLVALAWDDHANHQAAQRWFTDNARLGFATCNVTQSGFLRVSYKLYSKRFSTAQILSLLDGLTANPDHSFWQDGPLDTLRSEWGAIREHNDVTDFNLCLIAERNRGQLATFDRKIKDRLPPSPQLFVEVVTS